MERYDMYATRDFDVEPEALKTGEWVKYTDHEATLDAERAKVEALEALIPKQVKLRIAADGDGLYETLTKLVRDFELICAEYDQERTRREELEKQLATYVDPSPQPDAPVSWEEQQYLDLKQQLTTSQEALKAVEGQCEMWECTATMAQRETEKVRAELNETWIDEKQTVWTRPTAWAYAMVCKARDKWQSQAEQSQEALRVVRAQLKQLCDCSAKLSNAPGEREGRDD